MSSPIDDCWACAWRAYERTKRRWGELGCDPKRQPRFDWDPRPEADIHGAKVRTTTGKVNRFYIRDEPNEPRPVPFIRAQPRQPGRQQRHKRPASASRARGDPDPEERSAITGDDSRMALVFLSALASRDSSDGRKLGVLTVTRKPEPVTLPVSRGGVACAP